jgi:serine/threonine-protein kinase
MRIDREHLRRALNLAMRNVYKEAALLTARPCEPTVARDQRPEAVLWSWLNVSGAWNGTIAVVQPIDLALLVIKQVREDVVEPVATSLILEVQGDLTTRVVGKAMDQLFAGGAKPVLSPVRVGKGAPDVRRGDWHGQTWAVGGWWAAVFVYDGVMASDPTPTASIAVGELAPDTERVTNPEPLTKVLKAKGDDLDVAWPAVLPSGAIPRAVAPPAERAVAPPRKPVVPPRAPVVPPRAAATPPPPVAAPVPAPPPAAITPLPVMAQPPPAAVTPPRAASRTTPPTTKSSTSGRRNVVRTIHGLLPSDTAMNLPVIKPPTTNVVRQADPDRTAPWYKSKTKNHKRTDFQVPEVLGHYRIDGVLGEGGMGVVLKASHTTLDRHVAIKLMKPSLAGNPTFAERFMREARIAASLEHPNLVNIYDAAQEGGFLYMALRFMGGGDLADQLKREGPLSEPRAVHMFSALLSALNYINSKRLVHRDIKPANVLLDSDFSPRLGDLGLVRTRSSGSDPSEVDRMGTPSYMSPEQLYGDQDLDIRSDIYSLGLTLYVALTCKQPLQGEDLQTTISNVLQIDPPDPRAFVPAISEAMTQVVMKAIRKRPQDRYQTPKEFLEALAAVEHEALNELSASGVSWFGKIFGGRR